MISRRVAALVTAVAVVRQVRRAVGAVRGPAADADVGASRRGVKCRLSL